MAEHTKRPSPFDVVRDHIANVINRPDWCVSAQVKAELGAAIDFLDVAEEQSKASPELLEAATKALQRFNARRFDTAAYDDIVTELDRAIAQATA